MPGCCRCMVWHRESLDFGFAFAQLWDRRRRCPPYCLPPFIVCIVCHLMHNSCRPPPRVDMGSGSSILQSAFTLTSRHSWRKAGGEHSAGRTSPPSTALWWIVATPMLCKPHPPSPPLNTTPCHHNLAVSDTQSVVIVKAVWWPSPDGLPASSKAKGL